MLEPAIRDLARDKNFAALSVRMPNGQIGTHVMWVDADDDHVLINTEIHRAKFKGMQADPNVTVMIWKLDDPYAYAEVRGVVSGTVGGQEARDHIDALSQKYKGTPYASAITSERVIVQITPERQIARKV
ncbi:MAG TPA: pyridoxamine 5'-phosphate oxidase family protein [Ilumatobacteraceae bacterium]|nr:pyridoxamine 5'-phosphate oxidase family protein [Ilumatobacteraceae bacterium]